MTLSSSAIKTFHASQSTGLLWRVSQCGLSLCGRMPFSFSGHLEDLSSPSFWILMITGLGPLWDLLFDILQLTFSRSLCTCPSTLKHFLEFMKWFYLLSSLWIPFQNQEPDVGCSIRPSVSYVQSHCPSPRELGLSDLLTSVDFLILIIISLKITQSSLLLS